MEAEPADRHAEPDARRRRRRRPRLWDDLRALGGAGRRRRGRAAAADRDRAARRRPRPARGRPGHRQDAARPRRRPRAGPADGPHPGHARPPPVRRHRAPACSSPAGLRFVPGPVFTNLLLVDEINRATPRTQSALLEAMQERQVSIEGTTHRLPGPVPRPRDPEPGRVRGHVRAAPGPARPVPAAGPHRLPGRRRRAADRPPLPGGRGAARRHRARASTRERLLEVRDLVRTVRVADEVEAYLVAVVRATREHPDLELGASPRATVALYRAAQAAAVLAGRAFVTPDDVKARRARGARAPPDRQPRPEPARRDRRRRAVALDPGSVSRRRRSPGPDRMAGRVLAAIALILVGSVARVPIAILLGRRHAAARRGPRRLGARRPRRHPLPAPPRRAAVAVRRDDPARDRGLEPPAAAAGLAARRRRGQRGRRGPGARRSTTARARHRRPAQRVDAPAVGAGAAPLPRLADRRGVFTPGSRGPLGRRPVRPPRGRASCGRAPTRSSSGRGRSPRPSWSRPTAGATSSARAAAWPRTRPGSRACARTPPATRCGASTPGRAPGSAAR